MESTYFSKRVTRAGDRVSRAIENAIMTNPASGAVISATGGFRKLRVADPGRGKGRRGGFRVIYFDLPAVDRTYLMVLYDKDEKDDLTAQEKKTLRAISAQLLQENQK